MRHYIGHEDNALEPHRHPSVRLGCRFLEGVLMGLTDVRAPRGSARMRWCPPALSSSWRRHAGPPVARRWCGTAAGPAGVPARDPSRRSWQTSAGVEARIAFERLVGGFPRLRPVEAELH